MLCRNLYILELYGLLSIYVSPVVNTISSTKRLGHISKQRMEKLIKDGILPDLNFSDFDTCIDCIKGKLTTKVDRCNELLRVIHTYICGPFTPPTMGGHKYFITFIDDYYHNGFFELIREKSSSLEAFKAFKAKVELQQGKKIKVIHYDRGGEYYGRYDETGRNPGPLLKYL